MSDSNPDKQKTARLAKQDEHTELQRLLQPEIYIPSLEKPGIDPEWRETLYRVAYLAPPPTVPLKAAVGGLWIGFLNHNEQLEAYIRLEDSLKVATIVNLVGHYLHRDRAGGGGKKRKKDQSLPAPAAVRSPPNARSWASKQHAKSLAPTAAFLSWARQLAIDALATYAPSQVPPYLNPQEWFEQLCTEIWGGLAERTSADPNNAAPKKTRVDGLKQEAAALERGENPYDVRQDPAWHHLIGRAASRDGCEPTFSKLIKALRHAADSYRRDRDVSSWFTEGDRLYRLTGQGKDPRIDPFRTPGEYPKSRRKRGRGTRIR